ncbi:MAG: hypothetical protein KGI59_02995 [Patescibacteria group bacterium]|nr:hypothetical protein [Patescibacteria group bacterium]
MKPMRLEIGSDVSASSIIHTLGIMMFNNTRFLRFYPFRIRVIAISTDQSIAIEHRDQLIDLDVQADASYTDIVEQCGIANAHHFPKGSSLILLRHLIETLHTCGRPAAAEYFQTCWRPDVHPVTFFVFEEGTYKRI